MNGKSMHNAATVDPKDLERMAAVAERLRSYRERFEKNRDRRVVFTYTYELMTLELIESLPDSGFADPAWIVDLDVAFATLYFEALDAHDEGGGVSPGWQPAFDGLKKHRTTVLEEMLLGMIAHIVWDLPHAAVQTTGHDTPVRLADFHRVNAVFGRAIERVQHGVSKRYNPYLAVLDQWAAKHDELLTNYGIRLARAMAWYNAMRITDSELAPSAKKSLESSTRQLTEFVLRPPGMVGWAIRLLRWLVSWGRRWPRRRLLS